MDIECIIKLTCNLIRDNQENNPMKWVETKVIFHFDDRVFAEDLIANVFYDVGAEGVVVETPGVDSPEDWGEDAVTPQHYSVTGYLPKNDKVEKRCNDLEEKLARLEMESGIRSSIVYRELNETDWAESWKTFFRPEKVSENVVVKPTWRNYSKGQNEIVLDIDPGMAFGTGTHPTTRMCIIMIEKYLKKGNSFLDVGTGSGILMIAASKLGAGKVWGTDNDDVAAGVSRKNLVRNKIKETTFKVIPCNLIDKVEQRFDIVAANITSKDVLILLESVKRVLADDGILVCSGIIEETKDMILRQMEDLDFRIIEMLSKDNWVAIACTPIIQI